MVTIPLPEFAPDRSRDDTTASAVIKNVLPIAGGYGPFESFAAWSDGLPDDCRGGIMAYKADGSIAVFAATRTKIYRLDNAGWTDVSRLVGGDYGLNDTDFWSAVQWGDEVIFCNANDTPQRYTLASSSNFIALANAPEPARYVGVSGDYLLLLSMASAPNRLWRSGINNITWWTPNKRGCDFQDLPDGGWITGMVGFETGAIIFSERAIRTFTDQPGSAVLFTLAKTDTRGVVAPQSIVQVGSRIFYLAEDGFFEYGAPSRAIGAERVDKTFFQSLDLDRIKEVQGSIDPSRKSIFWRGPTTSGGGLMWGYQWELDKWFSVGYSSIQFLLAAATPGYTLEELETILGYATMESMSFTLDARELKGSRPSLAAVDSFGNLGFFSGMALAAQIDTPDLRLGGDGRRYRLNGVRPIGNVSSVVAMLYTGETFGGTLTLTYTSTQQATGLLPLRASGRVMKLSVSIPAGTDWTDFIGIEIPPECLQGAGRR